VPDLDSTLIVILVNGLLAWSLWLPVAGGQLSMAAPGTVAIGGYTAGYIALHGPESLALGLAAGAAAGALAGIPLGLLANRLGGFAFAIATIGLVEAVRVTASSLSFLGGPGGLIGIFPADGILPVGVAAWIVLLLLSGLVFRSRLGRMIDVVREDELQAAALGIRVFWVKLGLLVCAGAVSGFGGALLCRYTGLVVPSEFDLGMIIELFAFVALGGIGTYWGPFVGAAFLTYALEVLAFAGAARSFAYGVVIVVVMLLRPDGMLGRSTGLRARRLRRLLANRPARRGLLAEEIGWPDKPRVEQGG
jgi:branched-chain amino acid transport system permease protein